MHFHAILSLLGSYIVFLASKIKLSRGEICVANFIPPANGASQGNYFLPKNVIPKITVFDAIMGLQNLL